MAIIEIKTESLPVRCEICHQTDCFDAEKNYCSRCSQADIAKSGEWNDPNLLEQRKLEEEKIIKQNTLFNEWRATFYPLLFSAIGVVIVGLLIEPVEMELGSAWPLIFGGILGAIIGIGISQRKREHRQ